MKMAQTGCLEDQMFKTTAPKMPKEQLIERYFPAQFCSNLNMDTLNCSIMLKEMYNCLIFLMNPINLVIFLQTVLTCSFQHSYSSIPTPRHVVETLDISSLSIKHFIRLKYTFFLTANRIKLDLFTFKDHLLALE